MSNNLRQKPPEENTGFNLVDKWLQRVLAWASVPTLILTVIFNQTYLTVFCGLWLALAVGYFFVKKLRSGAPPIELGIATSLLEEGSRPELTRQGRPRLTSSPPRRESQRGQASKAFATEGQATKPEANIICLGGLDEFAKFENDFFQDIEEYGKDSLRVLGAILSNEPNSPQGVGSLENAVARVVFYNLDFPDREEYTVHHAYWLDEEAQSILFPGNKVRKVVFGVIDCDGLSFTMFQNNHESASKRLPASRMVYRNCRGFRIKLRVIGGEHSQWGREFDFVLRDISKTGFLFTYFSDEVKRQSAELLNRLLERLLNQGERFVTTPLINVEWEKLYEEIHNWRDAAFRLLGTLGRPLIYRFKNTDKLQPYPHRIPDGRREFFDELYTQLENLKVIAREHGVPVPASNVYKEIQEVTEKRREQLLKDLAGFADGAAGLIEHVPIIRPSELERELYVWDVEIFDYLSEHLDRADALLMGDAALENYTPPENTPVQYRDLLSRIHTRLVRLNRLIEEIRSGRRAV